MRSIVICRKCGEEKPNAGDHFCFRCYRERKRAEMRERELRSPGINPVQCKVLGAYNQLVRALATLRVCEADVLKIRHIVTPYLQVIEDLLDLSDGAPTVPVEIIEPDELPDETPTPIDFFGAGRNGA